MRRPVTPPVPRARIAVSLAAIMAATLATTAPARADAIDGNWCLPDGKHMAIDGPAIVTPSGTRTKGTYDRHAFSYAVPAKDPGAGSTINMILIDENTVLSRANASPGFGPGEADVWHRCTLPTS
jgi:hypothetical protein